MEIKQCYSDNDKKEIFFEDYLPATTNEYVNFSNKSFVCDVLFFIHLRYSRAPISLDKHQGWNSANIYLVIYFSFHCISQTVFKWFHRYSGRLEQSFKFQSNSLSLFDYSFLHGIHIDIGCFLSWQQYTLLRRFIFNFVEAKYDMYDCE